MAEKTISWQRIEGELSRINMTRQKFGEQMKVGANVITNWKSRGIPRGRAAQVARVLGTVSADDLLAVVAPAEAEAARPEGWGQWGDPDDARQAGNAPVPLNHRRVAQVKDLVMQLWAELAGVDVHMRNAVLNNLQSLSARIDDQQYAEHIAGVIANQLSAPAGRHEANLGNGTG